MKTFPIAVVLLLLPLTQLPADSAQPPPNEDWIISQDTVISDQIITMDWNLTVKAGARLELHNVSLHFNYSYPEPKGIRIEANATMLMENSQLNAPSIGGTGYFLVNGCLEMTGSDIYAICGRRGEDGGLKLLGGTCHMRSCTMYNPGYYDSIYINRSVLTIDDSTFSNNYNTYTIDAEESTLNVTNCSFYYGNKGISAGQSRVNITRCSFQSIDVGCELVASSGIIEGCDFGSRRYYPLPECGPITEPAPDALIQGCDITSYDMGIELLHSIGYYSSDCAIMINEPQGVKILNDSIAATLLGILVGNTDDVEVRSSRVKQLSSDAIGIHCNGFDRGECIVDGNWFENGTAILADHSAATIENNNIILNQTDYSTIPFIDCRGSVDIINNSIKALRPSSHLGIWIREIPFGGSARVSGNVIEGVANGIRSDVTYRKTLMQDNTLINTSSAAIVDYGSSDICGNTISRTPLAIFTGDNGNSNIDAAHILNNSISDAQNGIRAYPLSVPIQMSGNKIISNISAIELVGPSRVRLNITIDDNDIWANRTGIVVRSIDANPNSSSISCNAVSHCEVGIEINSSNIQPSSNRMENISEWGIYIYNSKGDFNGTLSYFCSTMPGACRLARVWELSVNAKYNSAPPGDPAHWLYLYSSNVLLLDENGLTVLDRSVSSSERLPVKEYKELANGSRAGSNPYSLTVSASGRGVWRQSLVMDSQRTVEALLQKGPDLVALALNMSEKEPFEGQLLFICATFYNNSTFNPDGTKVMGAELSVVMDGETIVGFSSDRISGGSEIYISAAWVATAGWHNVSVAVRAPSDVTDVDLDNNILTKRFFVKSFPVGQLIVCGTALAAWEPVNFSMQVSSSDTISGYRYDFGDGSASDWLPSPNISHVFSSAGEYAVRGWVATSRGAVRECSEPLRVTIYFPSSAMMLRADPDPAPSNRPVLFIAGIAARVGDISNAIWQFGDGGNYFGEDASVATHAYNAPGNFTVTLTVNTARGSMLVGQMVIRVLNSPPMASGRISPLGGDATTVFSFVSESKDGDGMISACRWELGDGNISYSPQALHTYANHGTYTVILTVQDDQGDWSASASFFITVNNTLPSVRMRAGRLGSGGADTYVFDGYGTSDLDDPAQNLSYLWDFGDGTTAEGINVTHKFPSPGSYQVMLTVEDGAGGQASRTVTVQIPGETTQLAGWMVPAIFAAAAVIAVSAVAILLVRKRPPGKKGALRPRAASGPKAPPPKNGAG